MSKVSKSKKESSESEEYEYFEETVFEPLKSRGHEYMAVPFAEKDQAKKLGAKWDKLIKMWYIPDDFEGDVACFAKWRVKNPIYYTKATKSWKDDFLK